MTVCIGKICVPGTAGLTQQKVPSSCAACEPGKHQPGYGAHQCLLCDSGQYQTLLGQPQCDG